MAILPQEKPQQVALIVIIAALAGMYAFYEYWYSPQAAEIEQLSSRLTQLEDQNRRAQVTAARGGEELEERLVVYERHVRRLEELIPSSEEVPTLLRTIASEAGRNRVELASWRPESSQPGTFYTRESYEMAVWGEYHNVGRFLTAIASLPRIITPVDVEMQPFTGAAIPDDMVSPVTVRFRIQTYVLPGGTGPIEMPDLTEGGMQ